MVTALCFFSKKASLKNLYPLTLSTPAYNHSVTCLGLSACPLCHKTHAWGDHQEPPCSTSRRHFQSSRRWPLHGIWCHCWRVHWRRLLLLSLRSHLSPWTPQNSFSCHFLLSVRVLLHAQHNSPNPVIINIMTQPARFPASSWYGFQVQTSYPQFLDCLLPPPM